MSKVTKFAVQTATKAMDESISSRMRNWEKKNPKKAKDIPTYDLAKVAITDPKWLNEVLAHVKQDCTRIGLYQNDFEEMSPMAAAMIAANDEVDKKRNAEYEVLKDSLTLKKDQIIRDAIIGGMDSADLLIAVNKFCSES